MELGQQIKALRLRRGITQEALAEAMGCTPQAVSKWEREESAPDIALLPALSAYFGVTIDDLFALTDDQRVERIRNMLWDVRLLDPAEGKAAADFLLEKGRREPRNGQVYELLAELENHLAENHLERAADYAKEALRRDPQLRDAHQELVEAMGGRFPDWNVANHCALIDWYEDYLEREPQCLAGYMWLMDQLLDDYRFDEAEEWCGKLARVDNSFRAPLYRGIIAWYRGDRAGAREIWETMEMEPKKAWLREFNLGDFLARAGEWEEAKAHYRRGLELQAPPRYTDGLTSIAQICTIQGDWKGAIAAHEEEIALLASDWATTSGEMVDQHRRAIAKLRERL